MGDKLPLRFLGLRETTQYTLEQSHGPSFSVALDNTTLGDEDSCGYPLTQNCPKYCTKFLSDIIK